MLQNEKYMGDVLLQKTYTVDFLTKKRSENKGQVDQYYIEGNHEAIIDKEEFKGRKMFQIFEKITLGEDGGITVKFLEGTEVNL
jgi:site-specific recombinase, resolvase family, putative